MHWKDVIRHTESDGAACFTKRDAAVGDDDGVHFAAMSPQVFCHLAAHLLMLDSWIAVLLRSQRENMVLYPVQADASLLKGLSPIA